MDSLKETIRSIKFLIEVKKSDDKKLDFTMGSTYSDYLLGQYIRNIWLPKEKYFVSKRAMEMWAEFEQEPSKIWDTFYQDKVRNESNVSISIDRYKGAEKTPWNGEGNKQLQPGERFSYREVFHDDHITTIKSIKDKLYNIEIVDQDSIIDVLNTIRVAKLLKAEDREISRLKKDLPHDLNDEIIKEYYAKKDIILLSFREWEN